MGIGKYVLNKKGEPVLCDDVEVWGAFMEYGNRIVAQDEIGDVLVSTVFLGLDHNFSGGVPVLWETMIFGGEHHDYQERYTSRAAALLGHARAVQRVTPPTKRAMNLTGELI